MTPWTVAHQAVSVHGVLQARILEWVAISFSRDLADPGFEHRPLISPALAGGVFTISAYWEATMYSVNVCGMNIPKKAFYQTTQHEAFKLS